MHLPAAKNALPLSNVGVFKLQKMHFWQVKMPLSSHTAVKGQRNFQQMQAPPCVSYMSGGMASVKPKLYNLCQSSLLCVWSGSVEVWGVHL